MYIDLTITYYVTQCMKVRHVVATQCCLTYIAPATKATPRRLLCSLSAPWDLPQIFIKCEKLPTKYFKFPLTYLLLLLLAEGFGRNPHSQSHFCAPLRGATFSNANK